MWDAIANEAQKSLVALLALAAVGGMMLLVAYLRAKVQAFVSKTLVLSEIRCSQKITDILAEIRIRCKADRVAVYLFHNGERYTNGNSILRLSGAYETVGPGISSQLPHGQGILVSSIQEAVEFLADEQRSDRVYYKEVENIPPCSYRSTLKSQGVEAVAKFPLHDCDDIIGFVCVDFVKRKPVIGELTSIPPAASRLEVYLKNNKKPGFFSRLLRRKAQ